MRDTVPLAIIWLADRLVGSKRSLVRSSAPPLSGVRIAMDLPNGRHGAAPNGGVAGAGAGAEETTVMRMKKKQVVLVREAIHGLLEEKTRSGQGLASRQQLQEEEQGLLSSLLTKVLYILCVWIVSDCRV